MCILLLPKCPGLFTRPLAYPARRSFTLPRGTIRRLAIWPGWPDSCRCVRFAYHTKVLLTNCEQPARHLKMGATGERSPPARTGSGGVAVPRGTQPRWDGGRPRMGFTGGGNIHPDNQQEDTQMRYLEVRRHTMRTKPGEHLSQAGVDLARRVGEGMGHFDRVVSTLAPRAFETAI